MNPAKIPCKDCQLYMDELEHRREEVIVTWLCVEEHSPVDGKCEFFKERKQR